MNPELIKAKKQPSLKSTQTSNSYYMKKIFFLTAFLYWILQSACVTSLNPLVTYDRAITDGRLTGTWKKSDGQEFLIQPVLKSDLYKREHAYKDPFEKESLTDSLLLTKSYIVEYSKGNGHYAFLAGFIRLNGQVFMNCIPVEGSYTTSESGGADLDIPGSMRSYTIAKVQWPNSNTLEIDFIDGGFLYDQIKASRMKIKHESDDLYDTFLITASPNELQQFIEKYGNDDRFFNKENSVTLTRKS